MLFKNFKDYKEFKELYVREDGKRKNAILLSFTTDKGVYEWYRKRQLLDRFYAVTDMNTLFTELMELIHLTSYGSNRIPMPSGIGHFKSRIYSADEQRGLCFDGDISSYRYVKNGRVYKKKIGRLVADLIAESVFGQVIPRQCKLWLCEEIGEKWRAHAANEVTQYTLVVDDDFESIYSTECYRDKDTMGSCMENDGYHTFYNDAVDALAASLRNRNGEIVSRCVIYTKATQVGTNQVMRLAERQYAVGGDSLLKRLLIAKLIEGGFIDAYKPAGAGCHEPRSWVDLNGNPLSSTKFFIPCKLQSGDAVSYQDSFKWYDREAETANNFGDGDSVSVLETTDGIYNAANYDSWLEEYTDDAVYEVFSDGCTYYTNIETREEEFRYVRSRGEWHHHDDVRMCEYCDEYQLKDDLFYSEETDKYYCCSDCLNNAEHEE